MSERKVVGVDSGKGGLQWDCPECNETNIGWPGTQMCHFCETEFELVDPAGKYADEYKEMKAADYEQDFDDDN